MRPKFIFNKIISKISDNKFEVHQHPSIYRFRVSEISTFKIFLDPLWLFFYIGHHKWFRKRVKEEFSKYCRYIYQIQMGLLPIL